MQYKLPGKYMLVQSMDDLPYDLACPIPKGSCVIKVLEEVGDNVKLGTTGETVGGFFNEDGQDCYVVLWDANLAAVSSDGREATPLLVISGDRIRQIG